jgi:D-alanyl-D-alanine carboxypeptidase (penicillin-binding protein 5/6)
MWWWAWIIVALLAVSGGPGFAKQRTQPAPRAMATILIDADSGQVLEERNGDAPFKAGSFSQLMLVLLSLEQAELGGLPLDVPVTIGPQPVPVRANPGANVNDQRRRIPLREADAYLLSDLLKALILTAADDAAIAVAEATTGSISTAVDLMNARAARLGMTAMSFAGVGHVQSANRPDTTLDTVSARGLARLAQALLRYPAVLEWASLAGLPFHNGAVLLRNGNQLIGAVPDVDGMHASGGTDGYGVVATARRGGLRLVAVVLGAPTSEARYRAAIEVLDRGFSEYERVNVIGQGERVNVPVRVANGSLQQVIPVAARGLSLLRQRGDELKLDVYYQVPSVLTAPLQRDEPLGELIVRDGHDVLAVIPLLCSTSVASTSILASSAR